MSVITNNLLLGDEGYFLTKSLRFRSSAGAYLTRTPASAGNRKTWTYSIWLKKTQDISGSNQDLLSAGRPNNPWTAIYLSTGDGVASANTISISTTAGVSPGTTTTAVFRDPSAWYHIVIAMDTTQATASNRVKLWVNNVLQTFSYTNYPSQNSDTYVNSATSHSIGSLSNGGGGNNLDGYLAEVNLIDGQALTPSSFGETDSKTGVWIPKKYTGTYGTNGFYLPFTDVATTSGSNAGLGKDFSGNGNYWTTNNISVTSGSTYDSMKDVPTLTDADTANYCTWNPLAGDISKITVSDGNLNAQSTAQSCSIGGTIQLLSGKWYWETTITKSNIQQVGIIADTLLKTNASIVAGDSVGGYIYLSNGAFYNNGSTSLSGSSYTTNDVISVAYDADSRKLWFAKNGTWQNSGVPASGTGQVFTASSSYTYLPVASAGGGTDQVGQQVNFGQRPFAYTPPTGFKALNTFNLPTPTIGATASTTANKYFDATLYTGNGTSLGSTQTITNAGSFQPDFVWLKSRSDAQQHNLYDAVRGINSGGSPTLFTDATTAETTYSGYGVSALNSNGFTVIGNGGLSNTNGFTYVGWQWKANGSGSSNTAGSITSTVSANTTAGFSIVRWTGTSGSSFTIGHGLGVTPNMIILKNRSRAGTEWCVYHQDVGNTKALFLNSTGTGTTDSGFWNNTNPSSTVFTTGNGYLYYTGGISDNYVAYCFAQVAGYSAFGSYTGNGSSDGTMVFTGFRPRFVLIKRTDSGNNWFILDTSRDIFNLANDQLLPNSSAAESTNTDCNIDILSNGFKLRTALDASNGSGGTYIYMAVAENPFKYSNAR